jgi:integrase
MSLTVDHLEVANCGLRLDAAWTKGRREDFQPLPKRLVESLTQFIDAGIAKQQYNRFYDGRTASQWTELPEQPLLYVPTQAARTLDTDLKAAGIPKATKEGKVDFHACRTAYVTHVLGQGATVKEAQTLARHKTPNLTMNVYGRTEQPRLTKLVEGLADEIFDDEQDADSDEQPEVAKPQVSSTIGAQRKKGDLLSHPSQTSYKVRARGVEPPPS